MASILKIKRSTGSVAPSGLASGELAYSSDETGGFVNGKLYVGTGSETAGAAANIEVIGGKYFTNLLDHTPGTLQSSSALLTDANSKLDQLKVDNLDFNGNTLSSTNTNGDINITPNGTGKTVITNIYIDASTTLSAYIQSISGSGGGGGSGVLFSSTSTISSNTTAATKTFYVLTSSLTLTLPATPTVGDYVGISNQSNTITCVVGRNSEKIMNLAEDMTIDVIDAGLLLYYTGASRGWAVV
jgi:hypothetical protein